MKAVKLSSVSFMMWALMGISVYTIARALGQIHPFPHNTITQVSTHYPGYLFIRILMLGSFAMYQYLWVIQYNMINHKIKKLNCE